MPPDAEDQLSIPPRVRALAQRAAAMFESRFARPPRYAAYAPGRVNLIGEHTDYNQGFVLPIAIERETMIVADRSRGDAASTLLAADLNETMEVDLASPLTAQKGRPGNYLLGVADQFQQRGFALPQLDVLVTSTVPIGAGLSSSAAVEVAFTMLLTEILHARLSPLESARLAQAAEHAFPGTPCGIMDMYASAAAKRDRALLVDCRSEQASHVPCDFNTLGATLLVIDTGVKHDLATSAYAERRATCAHAARMLGVPSLRGATIESLNMHGLTDVQRRRALHVIAENTRTVLAAEALALGELPRFGELMFQSHASLSDLYEVSCAELNMLVATANSMREAGEGVHGARMTGGGFGGCAIVLCVTTALNGVRDRLRDAFVARFGRDPAMMFTTCAAGGARALELGR